MQTLDGYNDEQLFILMQSGDEEAFNIIFERYRKRLFIEAYTKLHDEEEAMDITQEVFAWLWGKRKSLEIGNCLKPYLLRVVKNKVIDKMRKNTRDQNSYHQYIKIANKFTETVPFENKELGRQLNAAINLITPASRIAFVQLYVQQKSLKEIADAMEINVQSVKNHVHRALKVLRQNLKHSIS